MNPKPVDYESTALTVVLCVHFKPCNFFAQFIIFLAIKKCWPNAEAKMSFTVGSGLYIKVSGAEDFSVITLKEEIQRYVKEHTAPYKYPRIVVFRDELPKTISGKIQRNQL